MKFKKASLEHLDAVYELVQETIQSIYPRYYPQDVVDFFCKHHQKERIQQDIDKGHVYILLHNQQLVGTGSYDEQQITRVFVSPEHQGNGFGSFIIKTLESMIFMHFNHILLDTSLSAVQFYEYKGYKTIKHEKIEVANNATLMYEVMEKVVHSISYEGRHFIAKSNTENGEVSEQTVFSYHQKDHLVWANYSGGEIKKGFLLGIVMDNDELDFHFQHVNQHDEMKIGKCHSIPKLLEDDKIELFETWEWLNGDHTLGSSVLIECDK